jgi:hypothetical protein
MLLEEKQAKVSSFPPQKRVVYGVSSKLGYAMLKRRRKLEKRLKKNL